MGTSMTNYETVDYTLENGIATVRLNQPASLNAMTPTLGTELLEAIRRAATEALSLIHI